MKVILIALVSLVSSLQFFSQRASADTLTTVSTRPILFIHGFNVFGLGENCKTDWATMEADLAAKGFTGPKITIGYYGNDRSCDVITTHGSIMTRIPELSHDFAWYVYNNFTSQNNSIDIVAHSMGGLIVRYALSRIALGDTTYPPFLQVTHIATLASPFTGYSLLAEACHLIPINFQCDDMFPYSSFVESLKVEQALVPEGQGGTFWSNVGSKADFIDGSDGFVTAASATSMNIPTASKLVLPWYRFVFHTRYTHNKIVIAQVIKSLQVAGVEEEFLSPKLEVAEQFVSPESATLQPSEAPSDVSQDEVLLTDKNASTVAPAHVEPYVENGVGSGVQFSEVAPSGIFAKMGIENGDVVRGCTQANLDSPFEALASLEASNEPVTLNLCITRNGVEFAKQVTVR